MKRKNAIKKSVLIAVFGVSGYLCIALFRAISLGQNISVLYVVVSFVIALLSGLWLLFIYLKHEKGKQ